MKLLQTAVVGHDQVTVPLREGHGRTPADAVVGDPHDEVHEPFPAARLDFLDAADAAGDLGVLQRLADQQARVPPADLVADAVPEIPVLVPGAVRLLLGNPQAGGDVPGQVEAGRAGEPQERDLREVFAGRVLARPAMPDDQDTLTAVHSVSPLLMRRAGGPAGSDRIAQAGGPSPVRPPCEDHAMTSSDQPDTLPYAPHPAAPSVPLAVRAFGLTDPGRVRSGNEDHFLVADLSRTLRVRQTSLPQAVTQQGRSRGHVLLVADGMGGHAAGEVASALTVETVEAFVVELLRRFSNLQADDEHGVVQDLREAVRQADARILEEAQEHPELAGMGTTLTLAFVNGRRLFVVHAGDSRCYLLRGGKLERLTEDHTLVAELVGRGAITPEQARRHPHRHVVTNVLGGDKAGVQVDVRRATLEAGDVLLLCSDGLTEMLDDERIAAVLMAETEPEAACERLVAEANEAGGKDNITAVVARFDEAYRAAAGTSSSPPRD